MTTIKVTLNPDGKSCREKNEVTNPLMTIRHWNYEATLRTFEIEREPCTCHTVFMAQDCNKPCEAKYFKKPTHTAEIIEEYPETRGGVAGKVRIIS